MDSQQLLQRWFGTASTSQAIASQQAALWWAKNTAVDAQLAAEFGTWVEAAARGELAHWQQQPDSYLALILLLDQLPRNIFRGKAQSFAYDEQALQLARQGLALGIDQQLAPLRRVFFYLPFEHAEDLQAQAQAVSLLLSLEASVAESERSLFAGYTEFARRHHDVIQRFGRFPHRNAIIGRSSSPAEEAYLLESGSGF